MRFVACQLVYFMGQQAIRSRSKIPPYRMMDLTHFVLTERYSWKLKSSKRAIIVSYTMDIDRTRCDVRRYTMAWSI